MYLLRLWLFRILVLAAAAIMLVSAILPWWTAQIEATAEEVIRQLGGVTSFTVELYQHGIPDNPAREYFRADITPSYQVILAWVYIGVSVGLIALSAFLKGKKGRWLLGAAGFIYLAYAVIALIEITIRTGEYEILVQGETLGQGYTITTGFENGYYLAYVAGAVCIILALLRDRIIARRAAS